jgi:hypothetical protein
MFGASATSGSAGQFPRDAQRLGLRPGDASVDSGSNAVDEAFDLNTLGLAALNDRLLMAWLVDEQAIVRLIQPGVGLEPGGQDFWDISYARDLVRIR